MLWDAWSLFLRKFLDILRYLVAIMRKFLLFRSDSGGNWLPNCPTAFRAAPSLFVYLFWAWHLSPECRILTGNQKTNRTVDLMTVWKSQCPVGAVTRRSSAGRWVPIVKTLYARHFTQSPVPPRVIWPTFYLDERHEFRCVFCLSRQRARRKDETHLSGELPLKTWPFAAARFHSRVESRQQHQALMSSHFAAALSVTVAFVFIPHVHVK